MSNNTSTYFDLHINGLGYLNRARKVEPKRGDAFFAVDVAAIHGPSDDPQRVRFDCRVSGSEAAELVQQYMDRINDRDAKVLVGFRLGDLYTDTFVYAKGEKAGQTGVSLKARLLKIAWIKIDGQMVYKSEPAPQQTADQAA